MMWRLVLQYVGAGLLGVVVQFGQVVADDLIAHQPIDWTLAEGKALASAMAFCASLAIAAHLPDIGTARRPRRTDPPTETDHHD